MGQYIHFTKEQKERAASVDSESFLRQRGEKLLPSGRDKRLARDHSVTVRGCEWFDHASRQGGRAISFVQRFYDLSYPEAVSLLLDGQQGQAYPAVTHREEPPRKPFVLPEANPNMRRVFAYLVKQRHIDRQVVAHFAKAKTLFEDSKYHNCVFVGTDEQGVPRHAHKRSTNSYGKAFRQNVEGSDPRYSFHHLGNDGDLYVFEAPIDMLSFITMYPEDWKAHSYVACCGTSGLPVLHLLSQMPQVREVFLCLDSDEAGQAADIVVRELLTVHAAAGDVPQELQRLLSIGDILVLLHELYQTVPVSSEIFEGREGIGQFAVAGKIVEQDVRTLFRKALVKRYGALGGCTADDHDFLEGIHRIGISPCQTVGNAVKGLPVVPDRHVKDGIPLPEIDFHRVTDFPRLCDIEQRHGEQYRQDNATFFRTHILQMAFSCIET